MYQSGLGISLRRKATKRKGGNWYILTYHSGGGEFSFLPWVKLLGQTGQGASERFRDVARRSLSRERSGAYSSLETSP